MATQHTTLLIVGAGPTGLATALSLLKNGVRDFIIVDAVAAKGLASRAMAIHAATLEALETIDCAELLIERGLRSPGARFGHRTADIVKIDLSYLKPLTPFPYALLLSQSTTEEILEAKLESLGVQVLKPERAIGMKNTPNGNLEVSFESGRTISARYVIGADGAKSVIRQLAGVSFTDPDGHPPNELLSQMCLADVVFSSDSPHLPKEGLSGTASNGRAFFLIPTPKCPGIEGDVYRIGFNVPPHLGAPPSNPSIEYLQHHLNEAGPMELSSDPTTNPTGSPLRISRIVWGSRFRTHAAIASEFLVRVGSDDDSSKTRGIVVLVGDAAHIHSPAGGQGMNLGLRDAISLGPVLAAHIASTPESLEENDRRLEEHLLMRRQRALSTIKLTKNIVQVVVSAAETKFLSSLATWIFSWIATIPFIQRRIALSLSGLGNR